PSETLPLQPWALKVTLERKSKDDPEANCLPTGVPRVAPYPYRILQTATHMFFLFEGNIHSYRQIFLDGRRHPADPDPTWYGHSIGTFEGDTLVIDTIGFNDRFWFDFAGHPHTGRLHTIERIRRPDVKTLEYEVTIADADGRNPRKLLAGLQIDYNASFSFDGQWVVFTSERHGSADIFRVRANGLALERLTDDPAYDDQAALSPDGQSLAFVSTRDG